jgi:hypothetical protein
MDTNIPVLQPVTGSANLAALERITRYEAICAKSPWTSEELAFVQEYESYLFELQMVNFRDSVAQGDSEANRKAFFGSDYPALNRAYELENAECHKCGEALDEGEEHGDEWTEPTCDRCVSNLPPEYVAADYHR